MSTPIVDLSDVALVLRPEDDVAVTTTDVLSGSVLTYRGEEITVPHTVPRGHKLAISPVSKGNRVHKYGQFIGSATTDIAVGDHVHSHNLAMDHSAREIEFGTDIRELPKPETSRTFMGYRRPNGKWGTRNYIGIVTSVNCSASTARLIADQFRGNALEQFPNVHGVVALTHDTGCGLVDDSEGAQISRRTLEGYSNHPNIAGLLVLGLGCEMLQAATLLDESTKLSKPTTTLVIQEEGGIRATVRAGVEAIEKILPEIDKIRREPAPVSELTLGLNCGGSDGYSGITANPALGVASDLLVAHGGKSVLAETPEIFGAEHLLLRRAVRPEIGEKLVRRIQWWQKYMEAGGGTLDNNPSPGNKAGGLTTILEKSLGAVAKGGTAPLEAVYEYAEPIDTPGFGFMDTPGYDPVSVTGLVAGGANVVVFTTGRGSVLGFKPSPSIKVATNTAMYLKMREDMDLNAGRIVDGTATIESVGEELFEMIIDVASGRETVSEELDLGADEFIPWQLGAVT